MKVKLLKITDDLINNYKMLLDFLPTDRREATEKITNKEKYRSLAAGLLLSLCMEECGINFREVKILRGKNGKPYIENDGFYFNLSHSGDYAAIVYGDSECGIDIQQHREKSCKIANRFFTENEKRYLEENKDAFFDIWACKESYLKALSVGLTKKLDSFECVPVDCKVDIDEYKIKIFKISNHSIAVCLKGERFDADIEEIDSIIEWSRRCRF